MSSVEGINNNQTLKEQLINDITLKRHTLRELSEKYSISMHDLFLWLKTLEGHIHTTLSNVNNLVPQVDDEEWLSMTLEEQESFIEHLNSFEEDGEEISIEDIDQKIEEIKKRN